jgi:O-antigen ligase
VTAPPHATGDTSPIAAASARLALFATAGAAAVVPVAYFPPLDAPFIAPKTALLQVAAALAFLAFSLHRAARPGGRLFARPVGWGIALVLATTLASWVVAAGAGEGTPYAPAAVARWVALFGIACGSVIVARDPEARRVLLEAATVGAAVVSVIGLWQHFEISKLSIPMISVPGSTFGNRNFGGEMVALSLPLGIAATALARAHPQRRRFVGVLGCALVLEVAYLGVTRTRGAWLGAAAGLATLFASWRPRLSRREVAVVLAGLAVAGGVGLAPGPRSARQFGDVKRSANGVEVAESAFDPQSPGFHVRVAVWRRSLQMWREHRIWGVGPGNWPVWFPRYAEPGARRDGVMTPTLVARQAHDDLLERGGETGIIGVVAVLALAAAVARAARRRARASDPDTVLTTAAGAGLLAALVGCGVTGFPLEMPGTLTLAGLGLGLCAGDPWPEDQAHGARGGVPARALVRGLTVAAAGITLVLAVFSTQRQLRASYWLGKSWHAMEADPGMGGAVEAAPAIAKARVLAPDSYRIWLRGAQTNLRLNRAEEADADAKHAIALEPWAPNAWATLAAAQLQEDDPRAAEESAAHALSLLADLPLALITRAEAAAALGDPRSAVAARAQLARIASAPSPDTRTAAEAITLLATLDYQSIGAFEYRARGRDDSNHTSKDSRALDR